MTVIIENGVFGSSKNGYNYTAMTLSHELADNWKNHTNLEAVTIAYNADYIRKHSELVPYVVKPQRLGISSSIRPGEDGDLKFPMSVAYHAEAELRVKDDTPVYDTDGTSAIQSIKFRSLGDHFHDDGTRKTRAERIQTLEDKYGHLGELIYDDYESRQEAKNVGSAGTDPFVNHIAKLLQITYEEAAIEVERWGFKKSKTKIKDRCIRRHHPSSSRKIT